VSRRLAAVALLVVLTTAACSGDDPALTDRAAHRLDEQVAAVEFAIAGGDYEAARLGLTEVRTTTMRLAERGEVDDLRAPVILAALEELDTRLGRLDAEG
jgi:hypothetical protein